MLRYILNSLLVIILSMTTMLTYHLLIGDHVIELISVTSSDSQIIAGAIIIVGLLQGILICGTRK